MARGSSADIPLSFPSAPSGLRQDLERLASGLQTFIKTAPSLFVPRWQRIRGVNPEAASYGFAAHFVLVEDQTVDFNFPRPNVTDGGNIPPCSRGGPIEAGGGRCPRSTGPSCPPHAPG